MQDTFTLEITVTERIMRPEKGELTNCHTNKKVVFGTRNN